MSNNRVWFNPFLRQCFVTCSVGFNIIGQGFVLGFPAVALPQLYHPDSPIPFTKDQGSWIASVVYVTGMVGGLLMLPLMQFSRKTGHYAATAPAIVGWVIMIFATNFLGLLIGRICCGISFGMLTAFKSVVVGEYTSPKNRGGFLTVVSLAQTFGIFFVHFLGSILTWKITAIIGALLAVLSMVLTIFSPESPSWLALKGRYDECRKAFHWLRGDGENEELEAMIEARKILKNVNAYESKSESRFKNIGSTMKKKELYKPVIVMTHAVLLIVFSGATVLAAYSTEILGIMMSPGASVHFWMVMLDAQRFVFHAASVFAIYRLKRRLILFSIGALSVLTQLAIAVYLMLTHEQSRSTWLAALLVNIQVFTIAVGLCPIPDVLAGEVLPLQYKGVGGMVSMISICCSMFVVLKTFSGLVDAVGLGGANIVYGGILAYNLIVLWFMLPETKGMTLQQIEDEFRGKRLVPEEMEAAKPLEGETVLKVQVQMKDNLPLKD